MKRYPETFPQDLEPYFSQHMDAMTGENLYLKSDIAAQLALRDRQIVALKAVLANTVDAFSDLVTVHWDVDDIQPEEVEEKAEQLNLIETAETVLKEDVCQI